MKNEDGELSKGRSINTSNCGKDNVLWPSSLVSRPSRSTASRANDPNGRVRQPLDTLLMSNVSDGSRDVLFMKGTVPVSTNYAVSPILSSMMQYRHRKRRQQRRSSGRVGYGSSEDIGNDNLYGTPSTTKRALTHSSCTLWTNPLPAFQKQPRVFLFNSVTHIFEMWTNRKHEDGTTKSRCNAGREMKTGYVNWARDTKNSLHCKPLVNKTSDEWMSFVGRKTGDTKEGQNDLGSKAKEDVFLEPAEVRMFYPVEASSQANHADKSKPPSMKHYCRIGSRQGRRRGHASVLISCATLILSLPMILFVVHFLSHPCLFAKGQEEELVIDPFANVSTPLRESMRDAHEGVTINVQYLDFQKNYMFTKFSNFEELTGAKINPIATSQATWFDDIEDDIDGAGFIDLYPIFGNWIPTFVQRGGFLDITDDVGNAVGLDWFDIMPAVRQGVASFQNQIWTVPLDGDVIIMLYRTDLVEGRGLKSPRTWNDVLNIAKFYSQEENADINGDGEADYTNCFSTATNDIAGTMFWSIASSFLQTRGKSEGAFFDTETFDPISASKPEAFLEVLRVYNELVQNSPFRDFGPSGWQQNLAEFEKGRCVLWFNYPGPTRILVSNQKANNMTGSLSYAPLPGMSCNSTIQCPYVSEDGANHSPFLASGGMSYVVNARAGEKKGKAAVDFTFYLSDPVTGFWDVAFPGSFLDPLRRGHTTSLLNPDSEPSQTFLLYGWEERQLPQLKEVTEFNFLHENYVMDLRILGANEYQEAGTIPHLINMWNGKKSAQETANAITESWKEVTGKYGLKAQRAMYRDVLGLAPYEEQPEGRVPLEIIIPVCVAVALLIVGLVALVLKQHHTIKYKTRDVNNAPKDGTVAILFTDIEGSTALWDASKSVMSAALEVHHDVIRKCIDYHKAYEVKTIGDSFMVAIPTADGALRLANDIQKNLLEADWPPELANMPTACSEFLPVYKKDEHPTAVFRGLRVRIGVHVGIHSETAEEGGQVQIQYDRVTKGYDYYGPATNVAARIEALCFGGQTLISSDIYDNLSEEVKQQCLLTKVGGMELKGVSHKVFLYQCLPRSLKGRRFRGVFRRRDSNEASIIPSEDDFMHLTESVNNDEDLTVDVMSLTPVELQVMVMRLRMKMSALQQKVRYNLSCDVSDARTTRLSKSSFLTSSDDEPNGECRASSGIPDKDPKKPRRRYSF